MAGLLTHNSGGGNKGPTGWEDLRGIRDKVNVGIKRRVKCRTANVMWCVRKHWLPGITISTTRIELMERAKLLGVILTSDLKWEQNTQYIVQRCNSKLWTLRRLKKLGTSKVDLLDV